MAHANSRMCHILKLASFVKKNNDVPFYVKRREFDVALVSSVFYGCEWLTGDLKPITKLYNWGLKQMLGVRITTTNSLCCIEAGCPSLANIVKSRQRHFFRRMWQDRQHSDDDPFGFALHVALNARTHTSRYLKYLLDNDVKDVVDGMHMMKTQVRNSSSSRLVT